MYVCVCVCVCYFCQIFPSLPPSYSTTNTYSRSIFQKKPISSYDLRPQDILEFKRKLQPLGGYAQQQQQQHISPHSTASSSSSRSSVGGSPSNGRVVGERIPQEAVAFV